MRRSYHAPNIRPHPPLCVASLTRTVGDGQARVTDGPHGSHHGCHWPLGWVINSGQRWGGREQVGPIVGNQRLSVELRSEQMAQARSRPAGHPV